MPIDGIIWPIAIKSIRLIRSSNIFTDSCSWPVFSKSGAFSASTYTLFSLCGSLSNESQCATLVSGLNGFLRLLCILSRSRNSLTICWCGETGDDDDCRQEAIEPIISITIIAFMISIIFFLGLIVLGSNSTVPHPVKGAEPMLHYVIA